MQGSPPCEICTAVRWETFRHCVLICAAVRDCIQKYHQHTTTQACWQTHTNCLRSFFTPSCCQALKIGLTRITRNTLPIQLDYTSETAFIHLCYAHACTFTHHSLLIVTLSLFLLSFLWSVWHIFVAICSCVCSSVAQCPFPVWA